MEMPHSSYDRRRKRYREIQDAFVHRRTSLSPVVLEVEPTTECDLACVFCPRDSLTRPRGRLSEDDFLFILENLGDPSDRGMLLLSGFGEPMLHEKIARFVKHAAEAGWFCGITTNGMRVTESAAERLLAAGLDVLQISLHAVSDLTYRRVVKEGSYQEVAEKVRRIVPLCENRIVLALNFTAHPWNRKETRSFASYWKQRGISHINFSRCHNRGGHFQGLWQASRPPSSPPAPQGCWSFRKALYVTWDGQLLACCNDLTGETHRGDLRRAGLRAILVGEKRRKPTYALCGRCDFPFR